VHPRRNQLRRTTSCSHVIGPSAACMIADAMVGWRNPARYVAPLALIAAGTGTYLIVHSALANKQSSPPAPVIQTSTSATASSRRISKAKFYVVRPNDTLSTIAARTGVSLTTLEALNPSVNPNALQPDQRLRLR
jgi:LysM repeat protein